MRSILLHAPHICSRRRFAFNTFMKLNRKWHIYNNNTSLDGALKVCVCFGAKMRGFDLYIGVNLSFETGIKIHIYDYGLARKIYEITFTPRATELSGFRRERSSFLRDFLLRKGTTRYVQVGTYLSKPQISVCGFQALKQTRIKRCCAARAFEWGTQIIKYSAFVSLWVGTSPQNRILCATWWLFVLVLPSYAYVRADSSHVRNG